MNRWAQFVLTHRKWIVGFWLLVIVVGGAAAGTVTNRLTVDFSLPNQPGTVASQKIIGLLHNGGNTQPYLVTVTMPADQRITGHEAQVGKLLVAAVGAAPNLRVVAEFNTQDKGFRTRDDRTAFGLVFAPFNPNPAQTLLTGPLHAAAASTARVVLPGASIGVTGEQVLAAGNGSSSGPGVLGETLLGAVGALAVLAFVFGSFLALLPLIVAAGSILATFLMLWPITYMTNVSFIVEFLIALVGLGVAIDYSLLLVTRWREERDRGRSNHDAVVVAMETAGRSVLFSGVIVAIGLLALIVLPVPFMRSMGYGGALIPLAAVFATLTFTPAILGGIGPKIDWPKIRHENRASKAWSRWASMIVRRRWVAAGAALAILAALVVALFGVKIGQASSGSLASNGPAYESMHRLEQGGVTSGYLTPIEVLTTTAAAPSAARELGAVPGVQTALVSGARDSTRDGKTVLVLIPKDETVNSRSVDVVRNVKAVAGHIPGVIGVAGLGADQIDFLHAVYGNFPMVLGIIALLSFVLLVRAFRSLLLPFKAVLLNLVSLAATLGAMVLFWQSGHGSNAIFGISATGAVTFWIPMMVFAFLFGLSMDYEVFILSRMREEYDASGSTDGAVVEGIGRTGRLVTCAALILFLAFTALASGPGTDLKVLATGLGIGILLDATIVRSLLVPSLVSLFGRWNWYLPASVARLLRVPPAQPLDDKRTLDPVG